MCGKVDFLRVGRCHTGFGLEFKKSVKNDEPLPIFKALAKTTLTQSQNENDNWTKVSMSDTEAGHVRAQSVSSTETHTRHSVFRYTTCDIIIHRALVSLRSARPGSNGTGPQRLGCLYSEF